jgi:integrase
MPKPGKYEQIQCTHFLWRLLRRDGVFYADGRSNKQNAGRHSLGTRNKEETRSLLMQLDSQRAVDLGLISAPVSPIQQKKILTLTEGRRLYEEHLARSLVTGGVRSSTRKRYRTVFDKFLAFASSVGITSWNTVDKRILERYAAHLEQTGYTTPSGRKKNYRHKTLHNELTILKQSIAWLIDESYLGAKEKINLPLSKAESERPYCWKVAEVAAIIEHCRQHDDLHWLGDVAVGLACTGLRIAELASLRWSDINMAKQQLSLTDETDYGGRSGLARRQTKSGRSRSFPIHPELMLVLKLLPHTDLYILHGPRGGRLKPDTVRNVLIAKVLEPLAPRFSATDETKGFKDGRLHSFRHYFCSRCADSGVPERIVMEWLGHADSAMVRHYYHLNDEEAKRQMDGLDLIGLAGKRFAGNDNWTADSKIEDSSGRESFRHS